MSTDWVPQNHAPDWQDYGNMKGLPDNNLILDGNDDPAPSRSFLDTTWFRVFAVLGMLWVTVMCFEAYQSSLHAKHSPRHGTTSLTPKRTHRKD